MEPSFKAATHSIQLGLKIINDFYTEQSAQNLGKFDAVNMSLVLEHIPNPAELLRLVHTQLNSGGLISIVVPNDFNPLQIIARDQLGLGSWWVAPPHHINYFDFKSLANLLSQCGFEVLHQEATFPVDMFLLMGEKYISNDEIGRACHIKRMNFEKSILQSGGGNMIEGLYSSLANLGLGREIVIIARTAK
jgi:SAM-dependent methyltransferase